MSRDWSEAWLDLIERPDPQVARRRHQGREFRRAGRVSDLRVSAGQASARVQGHHATPQPVELALPVLDEAAWQAVIDALASQVRHTARLLAGHAPDGLEAQAGVRLVPDRGELELHCDCGDDVWPCAHAAALWDALAAELAEDPFMLLRLRGRGRERLLADVAAARRRRARGDDRPGLALADLERRRWTRAGEDLDALGIGEPQPPATPAGPLRLLGDPPGWAGGLDAWGLLHPLVEGAAAWARDLEPDPPEEAGD